MQGYQVKQSSTAYPLVFLLISSTDHLAGLTGAAPTVTLSKAGGAFAAPTGLVTEIGSGWYKVAGNATDSGTLGPLVLHATATGADPTDACYEVVAFDPQSAASLGLTNLDAAVSSRSTYAGADTAGTTTLLARLTATRATNLDNLDVAVSTRSTFAGGAVASVTAPVTLATAEHTAIAADVLDATTAAHAVAGTIGAAIGGTSTYAGGDTPGTTTLLARLTDPRATNLDKLDVATSTLSTYSGGPVASVTAPVTAGNLPTDYQQRGVAVTLPAAPLGYGGASAGQLAAAVLATPANLLATDATGRVTVGTNADKAGYALAADGVDLVTVEAGINLRQAASVILAGQGGVLTGAGTTTITIKGGNVTETRVAATVDTAGNRSTVTLTPPA